MLIRPSFVFRQILTQGDETINNETKLQAKKEWMKPELIVLVRSKPEEAVLSLMACKVGGYSGGWGKVVAGCLDVIGGVNCVSPCSALVSS